MTSIFKRIVRIGAVFLALVFLWWIITVFLPHGQGGSIIFTINEGESLNTITKKLGNEKIIKSRFTFWTYTILSGNARGLQAGEYKFSFPISTYKIAFSLSNGRNASDVELLVPEGFTMKQIEEETAKLFGEEKDISSSKAITWSDEFSFFITPSSTNPNLEGFLFPDTYRFKPDATAENIIRKVLGNFEEKTESIREETKKQGKSLRNIVTVASILEKEVPHKDMPVAAGIIYKRLQAGVPLQVDATLVYVLGRPIKRGDIDSLNSPYNTYKYAGLPPGPISNPGLIALEAALSPQNSDYWYYLSKRDDGDTVFSRTLEEHNAAKAKYLK